MSARNTRVVCLSCRVSKRKCDGNIPCGRCIEKGKEDTCMQVMPKKRGRKRKVDSNGRGGTENSVVALIPGYEMQDLKLGQQQNIILSLMLGYADRALRERPGDIASCFGLKFSSSFIAVQYANGYSDPIEAFLQSYCVGAYRAEFPKFPQVCRDPKVFVGKKIEEMTVKDEHKDPTSQLMLRKVIESPSPEPCRPWIRRYRSNRTIYTENLTPLAVTLETTMFMNETGMPQWIFIGVVDALDAEDDFDRKSDLFVTSTSFDALDKQRSGKKVAVDSTSDSSSSFEGAGPSSSLEDNFASTTREPPMKLETVKLEESMANFSSADLQASGRKLMGLSNENWIMDDFGAGGIKFGDGMFDFVV